MPDFVFSVSLCSFATVKIREAGATSASRSSKVNSGIPRNLQKGIKWVIICFPYWTNATVLIEYWGGGWNNNSDGVRLNQHLRHERKKLCQ